MIDAATMSQTQAMAFTFGDPEPVLEGRDILDMAEAWWTGEWYEPPVSLSGLAKSYRANPHHASAMQVKRNVLASCFIPHPMLSRTEFSALALDFLLFGNGWVTRVLNRLGRPVKIERLPSKYMRRGKDGRACYAPDYYNRQWFEAGCTFQLVEPDPNQEIYGLPEYLAALQAAWLNEAATLFRRRYYRNGSHAGFILYMTDPLQDEAAITGLKEAMKNSKGPGNFRNLLMYAPGGKKDGMQILPIADVSAKDEFFNIKNVSRDDVLAAHRVPPQLMGIIPNNTGGFGSIEEASDVFARNELEPLMERLREINDWIGEEVIRFKPYQIKPADAA